MAAGFFLFFFISVLLYFYVQIRIRRVFGYSVARAYVDKNRARIAKRLFDCARFFGGLRLILENKTNKSLPERFVVLSNHQSLIDIPALVATVPTHQLRFVAKRELGRGVPLVSQMLRIQKHALINRKTNFSQTMKELKDFAGGTARIACPVIFPEGTRSRDGELGAFHTGAARVILERAHMPVLTVAIDGGKNLSTIKDLLHLRYGLVYRVAFLSLRDTPESKTEVISAIADARGEILAQLARWRGTTAAC